MSKATTRLSLEVPTGLGRRLEAVARATHRTKTQLAEEALRSFLDLQEWQARAIRAGMEDADAGRVLDHDPVRAWLESWGTDDEMPPPR